MFIGGKDMIKKNEQVAEKIISEYATYAQSVIEIEKEYSLVNYIRQIRNEAIQNGINPADINIDTIMTEFERKRDTLLKLEEEKLKPEKERLQTTLNDLTQEMLIFIFNHAINPKFKKEIETKIRDNNYEINYLNNFAYESGSIFQDLELMSKDKLFRIASLRETTDEITFDYLVLQSLNKNIAKMIAKVMNGESLEEEKLTFCREHNLSNEMEFQIYKASVHNRNLLDAAVDTQKVVKDVLNIDTNEFVDLAYKNMTKINIEMNVNGKKR